MFRQFTLWLVAIFLASALALPARAEFPIIFPLMSPKLSSTFGIRKHPVLKFNRHHGGVDLAAPEKSHVRAVAAGTVVFAGRYKGYGKMVTIQHEKEVITLYGHLSEILVNQGDLIPAGQIIGRVGTTGLSTGPHLHFEWREKDRPVDPLKLFPAIAKVAAG